MIKHKLKYLNLFEELSQSDIPYSDIDYKGKLNIKFPKSAKSINPKFNELTTEVTGELSIEHNTDLTQLTGFNQLQSVGNSLSIESNTSLHTVTGFESLQSVGDTLSIWDNTVLETVTGFNQLQSVDKDLWIEDNTALQSVTGFNQLQSVGRDLWINDNHVLETVTGFNQLQSVGWSLSIKDNPELTQVTGFESLQSVGTWLLIKGNSNLVTLSIPSTLIRSVDYKKYYIKFEDNYYFQSPEEFVNNLAVIQDCIEKFNPGLHSNTVVTQILENIETWGTPATQGVIINHLLSKGNYWSLIPENLKHLAEENYKHLYSEEFKNTGAKSVAKVATGVTYGLF